MQDHVRPYAYSVPARSAGHVDENSFITYHDIKRFVKRYSRTILVSTLIGILATGAYVVTAVPLYTAHTQIIIDPSLPQAIQQSHHDSMFSLDNAQVESQLEVLRSEKIAAAVVKKLKLEEKTEFSPRKPSLLWRALRLFSSSRSEMTPFERERLAMALFQDGLTVRRVGLSYAIDIFYTSSNRNLAAEIANATADAYVAEQIAARAKAARQGGLWLEERIDQLRKQMNAAALEAQEFRAKRDYRLAPADLKETTKVERRTRVGNRKGSQLNTMEELDSTAQTYRRIYESYLMAYTESVQKQSYPITNARVITAATRPLGKSHPRSKLILAFGCFMGALAGLGIAFFRYSIDRSIWDPRQIRDEAGVECLASVQLLAGRVSLSAIERAKLGTASMDQMIRSAIQDPSATVSSWMSGLRTGLSSIRSMLQVHLLRSGVDLHKRKNVPDATDMMNSVVNAPFSGFSHGIKTLKTAISLAGRARQVRCIAITSALPNEGKTTIAANLATLFALSGVRTLLVDSDLRNASLSRSLVPGATGGLLEAVNGQAEVETCIVRADEASGLDLLPASEAGHVAHSDDILGSERARELIETLRSSYEMIIFELPPLTVSLEGLSVSSMLDGTVVVAEWGKTPMPLVSEAIYLLRNARADILGVALNKVDASAIYNGDVASNYMGYAAYPAGAPR
jgi:capsular exopolysaccharide synthesis family protein